MRFFLPVILCIVCSLVLGGCAYRPPVNELVEYGRDEIAWEEIEADSIYQRDLKYARVADSLHDGVNRYIEDGFKTIRRGAHRYAVEYFNKAWLLDSLNPHIYMGFALTEMWRGNVKSAVKHYAKYRELYEKNPVPRYAVAAASDSVVAVPSDSVIIPPPDSAAVAVSDSIIPVPSDSIAAATMDSTTAAVPDTVAVATPDTVTIAPDIAPSESYVYGKLVSFKNDWGFRLEPEWCDVAISNANEELKDRMLNSDVLPENERLILYRHYIKNYSPVRYVAAEIKVLKIFDKASGKWVAPPKDSVYSFSFVEREGLFLDEEIRRLVSFRAPAVPDSSARVFLLKPYAYRDDALTFRSYSDKLTEQELANVAPKKLKLKPYQERHYIEPSPIETPVRSSIVRALVDGRYDSLRTFLNMALELEKHYGEKPLSDGEYVRISLLDSAVLADSVTIQKGASMRAPLEDISVNDSLKLLIAYRSYPYVFTDEFFDKVNPSPQKINLINMAQQPFYSSVAKIPDNRTGFRTHFGPRVNVYEGSIHDVIGPASVGGELNVEGCLLYGCLGVGFSIYGQVDGEETIMYDGEEYDRSLSGDVSFLLSLGIRPFVHRHGDLELYGIANLAGYSVEDSTVKTIFTGNFGVGAAVTYLFFDSDRGIKDDSMLKDVRFKAEYFWNSSPKKTEGLDGHTLAFSLQFGFGMTSYTYAAEKDSKHEFSFRERMRRFWME